MKTKKQFSCMSVTTGKRIIPDVEGNYDFQQSISREEELVPDAMKWSVNSAFVNLREFIEIDFGNSMNKKPFSLNGQTHKDKLLLKDLMKKYPTNFWVSSSVSLHVSGQHLVFENVDYETVKVESKVSVRDVPYDTTYLNGYSNNDGKSEDSDWEDDSKNDQKIYKIYLGVGGAEDDCHIVKFGDKIGNTGISIDVLDKDKLGIFLWDKFEDEFSLEVSEIMKTIFRNNGITNPEFLEEYHSEIFPFRYELTDEEPNHYIFESNGGSLGLESRWLTSGVHGNEYEVALLTEGTEKHKTPSDEHIEGMIASMD